MFFDDEDGWLDVSGFLLRPFGFVPLIIPVTEPAIGYGLVGGPVFIKRAGFDKEGEPINPTTTMLGAMWTEHDTTALFAGTSMSWLDGKLQTVGGAAWADVHLKFSGFGKLTDDEVNYAIRLWGGGLRATYKLGKSKWRAGMGYLYINTDTRLQAGPAWPAQIPIKDFDATIAGISPTIIYDSRDNVFTPTRGLYAECTVPLHGTIFGGDRNYEMLQLTLLYFRPLLQDKLFGGIRLMGEGSWDDAPFFVRPYVDLRGAEAMRYQGQYMAEGELELRWQFTKRFSLVGFGGYGYTRYNIDDYRKENHVVTGGVGFRYMMARLFGLHMGIDVAFGPDDPIYYITFGSAWARP